MRRNYSIELEVDKNDVRQIQKSLVTAWIGFDIYMELLGINCIF